MNDTQEHGENKTRWIVQSVNSFDNPIFQGESFCRHSAFMWLVAHAAWKQHRIRNKGKVITLERGQCLAGLDFLAKKWGWGVKKVRNFLSALEAENMIKKDKSKGHYAQVITICNYEKYQHKGQVQDKREGKSGASAGQERGKTVQGNTKVNNNTNSNVVDISAARASDSVAGDDLDLDLMVEACNGALDNPVNCMGLLSTATPQMWIDTGCDFSRDVMPTLRAAGKKYHGKRIRSWNYFTDMIVQARDQRTRGLPAHEIHPDEPRELDPNLIPTEQQQRIWAGAAE